MSIPLRETIVLTATYYGKEISESLLEMYVGDLEDLDPVLCCEAYKIYRRNPKNRTFPLPAQIREIVCPEDHITPEIKAREVAARIVAAIPKFGWCNGAEAAAFIGHEGWEAVQRQGGWAYLCEHFGESINPTAFQAQIRDQLVGSFTYGLSAIEKSIGAVPEIEARGGSMPKLLPPGLGEEPPSIEGAKSLVSSFMEKLEKKMKESGPEGAA